MKWERVALGIVVLVILALVVRWIVYHWSFVVEMVFFTAIAGAVAWGVVYIQQEGRYERRNYRSGSRQWIWPMAVFFIIFFMGWRTASFDWQIARLEEKFIQAAGSYSYTITDDQRLDYGGELTKILDERDELLQRYWYRMNGEWWVSTDDGAQINATYHWSPF